LLLFMLLRCLLRLFSDCCVRLFLLPLPLLLLLLLLLLPLSVLMLL
jgi:hypothetical protein